MPPWPPPKGVIEQPLYHTSSTRPTKIQEDAAVARRLGSWDAKYLDSNRLVRRLVSIVERCHHCTAIAR